MFFKALTINGLSRQARRVFLVLAFATTLAACQTTGLKPGALDTDFPPAGWITRTSGGTTAYLCPRERCKTPQLVSVSPMKIRGNVEDAIRNNVFNAQLMAAFDNLVEVASKRAVTFGKRRRISTRTYSGFETMMTVRNDKGKKLYIAIRHIIQKDRGVTVGSASFSRSLARRNLRRYLAQTTIRRVN